MHINYYTLWLQMHDSRVETYTNWSVIKDTILNLAQRRHEPPKQMVQVVLHDKSLNFVSIVSKHIWII